MSMSAMGRVGDIEKLWGTKRSMRVAVLVVATAVLLSAPVGGALSQHYNICSINDKSVELYPYQTIFLGTNNRELSVTVKAAGCVSDKKALNVLKLTASNSTSQTKKNLKWFEFTSCGNFMATIGEKSVKLHYKSLSLNCINKAITVNVESDVQLGRKCSSPKSYLNMKENKERHTACKAMQDVPGTAHSRINKHTQSSFEDPFRLLGIAKNYDSDSFSGDQLYPFGPVDDDSDDTSYFISSQHESKNPIIDTNGFEFSKFPKIPRFLQDTIVTPRSNDLDNRKYDNVTNYSRRRNYKNAIPIFIGIVAFTISMCLRFCLCRGKTVVRRVTTVTVIRSRSPDVPQDRQDPPPSYVDVVSDVTPPQNTPNEGTAEPPPPAYADIVDEVQLPPTYSEVEAQSIPSSDGVPLADQTTEAYADHQPADPESATDAKGSATSKNVLSKYRSQRKQFAFKVLEENE